MDLRDYLAALKKYGMLKEINEEVDWNLEASAVAAMNYRLEGPALHFKKIKGYPEGYTVATCLYAGTRKRTWRKFAVALGLDPEISYAQWAREFALRLSRPIKPTIVSTGPCKEEIHMGKEVNMFEFPSLYIHSGDGGRYMGTCHANITKDPDSDWVNWGQYRWMIHTKNKLGGNLVPGAHQSMHFAAYEKRGEPMPFCITMGGDPAIFVASTLPLPVGTNEADFVGGLRKAPVELVRAETNDLLVPANAEIVIEGEMRPGERLDEGPFGEYDGFMNRPRRPRPVYRVNCITHRKNPILPAVCEGFRLGDSPSVSNCTLGPLMSIALKVGGIKYSTNALILPETSWAWPVFATKVPDEGYIGEFQSFVWSIPVMGWIDKAQYVDSEVDINDSTDVLEEFACRLRPDRIYRTRENKPAHIIVAWLTPQELAQGYTTCVNFDCTTHPEDEKPQRIDFEHIYSQETQEWVASQWQELGLEEKVEIKKVEPVF